MEEVTHLREERVAVYQSAGEGVSLGRQLPPPVPPPPPIKNTFF
jgi:hypothetical protein